MSQNGEKYIITEDHDLLINARKPVGELGRELLNRMNKSHETLAQWGVSHLNIANDDVILDIDWCRIGTDFLHSSSYRK